ncbi:MAG: hypothetical protein Q4P71_03170 [Actinomycetaceae bacterium]|nr:hypothetical protein [Actinomycetaceae bacterium]
MTIHLAIDDTALRAYVEELFELIRVRPDSRDGVGALVITDGFSPSIPAARAVIRLGTDLELPRDDELFLDLVARELCREPVRPNPIVAVAGASGTSRVSSLAGRACGRYRGARPLAIVDLGDDPNLRASVARIPKLPQIITWKDVAVDQPVVPTRLGERALAVLCGYDSPPPDNPVPWIASLARRGPVLIDAGRITASSARLVCEVATHVFVVHHSATSLQVRAAIERLSTGACEVVVSGRRPHASWARQAQWRRFGAVRYIAHLLEGDDDD